MSRNALWILGGLFVAILFGVQFNQISKLKTELRSLRTEISVPPEQPPTAGNGQAASSQENATQPPQSALPEASAHLPERLAQLERTVAGLAKSSRAFTDRGMGPLTEDKIAQMQQRFFDPATPENERINALRMLHRGNQMSDDVATQALSMLQSSTNANFRREILDQLQGLTNAVLKQPLIAMLDTETGENGVREQLVNALRRFVDDPAVESKMWDLALNDPNTRVRDQAREAVARAPATPERIDQLRSKAASTDASLEERLISFRALRLAKSHTPEIVSELATMAQNSTDPIARAKLFKSFNGLTDESLMAPLVNGLQDADPVVRQSAADSLSSFSDPRVQQWLTHLIQNDTDPAVKREAHAALEHSQRLSRRGPQTP